MPAPGSWILPIQHDLFSWLVFSMIPNHIHISHETSDFLCSNARISRQTKLKPDSMYVPSTHVKYVMDLYHLTLFPGYFVMFVFAKLLFFPLILNEIVQFMLRTEHTWAQCKVCGCEDHIRTHLNDCMFVCYNLSYFWECVVEFRRNMNTKF